MKFPTHYLRPAETQGLENSTPWLVYGWQTHDGMFTAIDGRKYPAELAVPIGASPTGGAAVDVQTES